MYLVPARHVKPKLVASLYLSGLSAPNLGSAIYEKAVFIEDENLKILQGVVALETFHNAERGRFETVMMQNDEDNSIQDEPKKY